MAVYVDEMCPCLPNKNWRYNESCNMYAPPDNESDQQLHAIAAKIGLERSWFQKHERLPHYDLTRSKRKLALLAGALPADRRMVVDMMNEWREAKLRTFAPHNRQSESQP